MSVLLFFIQNRYVITIYSALIQIVIHGNVNCFLNFL